MSSRHALKANHPHGSTSLDAKRNGINYEAHVLHVPQSSHSTDQPSDIRASIEDYNEGARCLMGILLCHGVF